MREPKVQIIVVVQQKITGVNRYMARYLSDYRRDRGLIPGNKDPKYMGFGVTPQVAADELMAINPDITYKMKVQILVLKKRAQIPEK